MLKKLIKHELYATARFLIPLYLIMVVLSLANRLLTNFDIFRGPLNTIRILMLVAYVISIVASLAVTFILIILRFYKNLMSEEGYLMFTLPVKTSQLINSKLIVSIFWCLTSILVVISSLLILFATNQNMNIFWQAIDQTLASLKDEFGDQYILFIFELLLMIIANLFLYILLIYGSIAIGHSFTKNKIISSFASYAVINTAMQIIMLIIILFLAYITGIDLEDSSIVPKLLFPTYMIMSFVFNIVLYITTNHIFKRKLNLE
ncbi:MAG: hypothetical protein GX319_05195 [Clostridiales bacterium]|jgi:hypothetical protein|nr:hypothetical protein [Bacillota bacterium]NLK03789.1 hypothetical protein [Clostridiales bacterium]